MIIFNVKMFKTILSLLLVNNVFANPIAPDCINNYTTFYNKYVNESNVDIYNKLTGVSGTVCGSHCSNNTNCTSFNQ